MFRNALALLLLPLLYRPSVVELAAVGLVLLILNLVSSLFFLEGELSF